MSVIDGSFVFHHWDDLGAGERKLLVQALPWDEYVALLEMLLSEGRSRQADLVYQARHSALWEGYEACENWDSLAPVDRQILIDALDNDAFHRLLRCAESQGDNLRVQEFAATRASRLGLDPRSVAIVDGLADTAGTEA